MSSQHPQGRNERCRCGSGKKFKHCHGSPEYQDHIAKVVPQMLERAKAEEIQRQKQQGLGNPIISLEMQGHRLVAVKNRLLHSKGWKTFHDFLFDYMKMSLGSEWGTAEIKKPLAERHPLLVWYQKLCDFQQTNFAPTPGQVSFAPATGAVSAYLRLAYDLFALDHNAEVQEKLLARLRNHDKFWGARYEVNVAAIFVRAGFTIEFEDESDRSTSHCEFTATHKRTGRKFSVEAKRREGNRLRIVRLFNDALRKHANHARVIFIDINWPSPGGQQYPPYLVQAQARLRRLEAESGGPQRPPAYVFVTNTPFEHHLDEPMPPCAAIIDGFQIPDFKGGGTAPSLRHAIEARERHIEMHDLMRSMEDHSSVPSTFDGDLPEYAFGKASTRIRIGERYMVPDAQGIHRPAEVTSAVVMESQRSAFCIVKYDDGSAATCTMPLSDEELDAWRQHPDTFFGVVGQRTKPLNGALEVYDFFHGSCKGSTKEALLEAMKGASDIQYLATLTQPELASIRAERLAYGILAATKT
jgi:hypothetical protein